MNLFLVCYSEPGIGDMIYPDGSIAKKITDGTLEEVGAASGSTVLLQLRLRA
jgi:hypothetical protein